MEIICLYFIQPIFGLGMCLTLYTVRLNANFWFITSPNALGSQTHDIDVSCVASVAKNLLRGFVNVAALISSIFVFSIAEKPIGKKKK